MKALKTDVWGMKNVIRSVGKNRCTDYMKSLSQMIEDILKHEKSNSTQNVLEDEELWTEMLQAPD